MVIAIDAVEETAVRPDRLSGAPRTNVIDRWIYVFTAASLIAVVFAGFIPDSFVKLAAIDAGKRPPFPPILHVHAALMGSFLLILFIQTVLVATEKRYWHMQLGIAGALVATAIIISGFMLVPTMYRNTPVQDDILLLQLRAGFLFAIFMWIALRARTRDAGLHKRMMFLAITAALGAAVVRIRWLPTTFPNSTLTLDLFSFLPLAPMFVWDLVRNRDLHRAYLVWAAFFLPVSAMVYAFWDTPGWHAAARQIMGV